MKQILILITSLLVLAQFSLAQEGSIKLNIRMLSWSGEIEDMTYLKGKDLQEFHAYDHILSRIYKYKGSPTLRFYAKGVIPDEVAPLASVNIPLGSKSVILLMTKLKDGKYNIKVIPDDESRKEWGVAQVFNTTNQAIAFATGKINKLIKPGETVEVKPTLKKGRIFYLRLGRRVDDQWMPFYTAYVPLTSSQRVLCFFRSRADERSPIEFKRIYDLKRPPEKKKAN